MKKLGARAIVRLSVEVTIGDRWGQECTVEQIQKQAKESALKVLRKTAEMKESPIKIVSELEVRTIIVEEES